MSLIKKTKRKPIYLRSHRYIKNLKRNMLIKISCVLLLIGLVMTICLANEDIVTPKDATQPINLKKEEIKTEERQADLVTPYWTWDCKYDRCVKSKISNKNENPPQSLSTCKLRCGEYRTLWPKPTGEIIIGDTLIPVNPQSVEIVTGSATKRSLENTDLDIIKEMTTNFKNKMEKLFNKKYIGKKDGTVRTLYINLNIALNSLDSKAASDEAYQIKTKDAADHINATITANTFFGGHHGVETLSQLIVYDPYSSSVVMPDIVEIMDNPAYPYRGILLDTARNFYPIDAIKRTIDGMAINKLNYFHWHITDTHSFPFESRKYPTLSQSGAYSSDKVYTREDIKDVVHYGLVRGVHVIPELDAPAHVGEGWNSIENHKDDLLVCFKKEPWTKFCVEPPCGQFNPVSDRLYEVLGDIYEEMTDLFRTDLSGLFHMGGDEVNMNCWKHTKVITDWMDAKGVPKTIDGFHDVWDYFQKRALAKLSSTKRKPKRVIIWTSSLTEGDRLVKYLDPKKYIIQIWTRGDDPQVSNLLRNKFPVIFSNTEALYLDCGYGAWIGEGNNWCSPYIGWQKIYENDPLKLVEDSYRAEGDSYKFDRNDPAIKSLIMGQEAALWSEQADGSTLDARLWPRAAAMAERLWSDPKTNWRDAELRFLHQRERLVEIGLSAESIEPEWCYQNEGLCGERRDG